MAGLEKTVEEVKASGGYSNKLIQKPIHPRFSLWKVEEFLQGQLGIPIPCKVKGELGVNAVAGL